MEVPSLKLSIEPQTFYSKKQQTTAFSPKIRSMKKYTLIILFTLIYISCEKDVRYKESLNNPELFNGAVQALTNSIVYDIFSPPVASRIYLYPTIGAYQVIQKANNENYATLSGQLQGLNPLPAANNQNVILI